MSGPDVFLDGRVTLHLGDVLAMLAVMPDDSVDCVVSSPPYWGLRDYGVAGQIGLEPTLAEHLAVMVAVFREVRRVLKPSGTCWVNYGDCYATTPNGRSAADVKALGSDDRTFRDKPFSTIGGTLKPKDLCMVPNRLAIALQDDGWWVRAENIWGKSNPMPESIRDRPATAHEKIFLLTKSGSATCWHHRDGRWVWTRPRPDYRWVNAEQHLEVSEAPEGDGWRRVNLWAAFDYFYDAPAVRQGRTSDEDADGFRGGSYTGGEPGPRTSVGNTRIKTPSGWSTEGGSHDVLKHNQGNRGRSTHGRHTLGEALPETERRGKQANTATSAAGVGGSSGRRMGGFNARWDGAEKQRAADVVSPRHAGGINHTGIEGTPRGSRNLRNYEPAPLGVWQIATRPFPDAHFATFPPDLAERCILAGCPVGGLVLDPFGGAGTTALVALRHRRRAALIELNPEYAGIARRRIERDWMGVEERRRDVLKAKAIAPADFGPLFGGMAEAAE